MTTARRPLSGLVATILALGCASSAPAPDASAPDAGPTPRRFHVRYVAELTDVPPGALRLWIPVPTDDAHQRISALRVTAPWAWRLTREAAHGNQALYLEATDAPSAFTVTLDYDVERRPVSVDPALLELELEDEPGTMTAHLRGSRLVVADERVRAIAADLAPGGRAAERARAFYDHVMAEMIYDKSGVGWGNGDSAYACDVGRGNCTDFHAYFMALCLAAGIPARFEIGLFGSYEPAPGAEVEAPGYHCWAEFRVPGRAWVPVDISEADKAPARAAFFFGNLTDNRVTLGRGRDIVLEPPQLGEPLNYFVLPYCEVDGRPLPGVGKTATWRDAAE